MISKLILGTVQFGLDYGINNAEGKPKTAEVHKIFEFAQKAGIQVLDTADAYGNAVDLIGNYHLNSLELFNVITKFKTSANSDTLNLEALVNQSLERLNIPQIFAYLYHSFDDYKKYYWTFQKLIDLKKEGKIKYIGVSIYTNEQFETTLNDENVDIIQLPYNLLDNDNQRGALIKKAKQNGKIIHVRSVFLQGLFFKDLNKLPEKLLPLKDDLEKIKTIANDYKISLADLALNYAVNNPLIDGVLVGVDNIQQLQTNLTALETTLNDEVIKEINQIFVKNNALLNPSNWL